MNTTDNTILDLEQALATSFPASEVSHFIERYALPYRELMSYYRCAIMEVETKFRVLDEQFSLGNDNNPIESIKTRLKSPKSIIEKMERYGFSPYYRKRGGEYARYRRSQSNLLDCS